MTLLSACGQNTSSQSAPVPAPNSNEPHKVKVPKDPAARKRYLDYFPLLNSEGEATAYTHPDVEGYPVGVLLGMLDTGEGTICSTSHLDLGYVVTNAHCVDRAVGADNYYVVYFDAEGVKRHSEVESIVYLGNPDSEDIAILKIPNEAALQWQTAGKTAKVVPVATATAENPEPLPVTFSVHIWAFDPLPAGGAQFDPRTCPMTRTQPTVVGAKIPNTGHIERTPIRSRKVDAAMHFFIDQCDRLPIHGNSGSLVTIAEHFDEKVGVYHWGIGTKDGKDKYDYIEYTGTSGRTRFLHEAADWQDMFGVGFLFEYFQAKHPQVLF